MFSAPIHLQQYSKFVFIVLLRFGRSSFCTMSVTARYIIFFNLGPSFYHVPGVFPLTHYFHFFFSCAAPISTSSLASPVFPSPFSLSMIVPPFLRLSSSSFGFFCCFHFLCTPSIPPLWFLPALFPHELQSSYIATFSCLPALHIRFDFFFLLPFFG